MKEYEKKIIFPDLIGLKRNFGIAESQTKKRKNKHIKQRSHHSIFEFLRKEGWQFDYLPI